MVDPKNTEMFKTGHVHVAIPNQKCCPYDVLTSRIRTSPMSSSHVRSWIMDGLCVGRLSFPAEQNRFCTRFRCCARMLCGCYSHQPETREQEGLFFGIENIFLGIEQISFAFIWFHSGQIVRKKKSLKMSCLILSGIMQKLVPEPVTRRYHFNHNRFQKDFCPYINVRRAKNCGVNI